MFFDINITNTLQGIIETVLSLLSLYEIIIFTECRQSSHLKISRHQSIFPSTCDDYDFSLPFSLSSFLLPSLLACSIPPLCLLVLFLLYIPSYLLTFFPSFIYCFLLFFLPIFLPSYLSSLLHSLLQHT